MSFDAPLPRFAGSCTALVTPFKNGAVDADSFCKLVDFQIVNGTAGLVPVGTTGESPTLSHEEHDLVVELCIKQAAGRVPVIAGAGSNSTAEAVRLAEHAANAGACTCTHMYMLAWHLHPTGLLGDSPPLSDPLQCLLHACMGMYMCMHAHDHAWPTPEPVACTPAHAHV